MEQSVLSLQELQLGIKEAIQLNFSEYVWVHAELSEVNIARNGHCYIELIEKQNEKVVAKVRATIWNFTFRMLKPYFESSTGYEFTSGIKVSLKVVVEFHEIYGLSLNVKDIDPNFTLGDVELQKRKILNQLEDDGIIDMNAELELPLVLQNIAVISSATAAGYGDWKNQIEQNPNAYHFHYQLFEAQMQGVETGASIVSALDQIYQIENAFDAVVIIRGGGSKTDLAGFDVYNLAVNIAQFPLPIITGIGHERDESIADIVAHTALKTPTAVADFLINNLNSFESQVDRLLLGITNLANHNLEYESHNLNTASENLNRIAKGYLNSNNDKLLALATQLLRETKSLSSLERERLSNYSSQIAYQSLRLSKRANDNLELYREQLITDSRVLLETSFKRINQIEHLNKAYNPKMILERGFAIVEQNNKIIVSKKELTKGESFKLIMKDGELDVC